MKISIIAAAALLLAGTSMAQAAWDQNQTVLDLQAQGFTHIEITLGATQAKVEASNGTTKFEAVYDLVTGDVLKSESGPADESEDPGIEIRTTNQDAFVEDGQQGDDQNDDHGGASGKEGSDDQGVEDDNSGSDDQGDDDHSGSGGDDNGSDDSDDSGDGDGGSDDGGSDNGGSDDQGGDDD